MLELELVLSFELERELYVCIAFNMIDDKHVIGEMLENVLKNEVHHFRDLCFMFHN